MRLWCAMHPASDNDNGDNEPNQISRCVKYLDLTLAAFLQLLCRPRGRTTTARGSDEACSDEGLTRGRKMPKPDKAASCFLLSKPLCSASAKPQVDLHFAHADACSGCSTCDSSDCS